MAFKIAHFPTVRELDGFDFAAQPSLDKAQLRALSAYRWVAHGAALLLLGPPCVGKTHLSIARGCEVIRQGYSALFVTASALFASLVKAHAEGRLAERLGFYAKPTLLIVDDLGYLSFEPNAAHLFLQLVSRRYERGSMLITPKPLDRRVGDRVRRSGRRRCHPRPVLHHSQVVTIRGDSYRLRGDSGAGQRSMSRACPRGSTGTSRARVPPVDNVDKPSRRPTTTRRGSSSSGRKGSSSGCRLTGGVAQTSDAFLVPTPPG
jgi:DNA replication protein DnaC